MRNTLTLVFIIFFVYSCTNKEPSLFFKNCACDKIDLSNGDIFTDSLGHYSVRYPNKKWLPIRNLDKNGNGITGGDTLSGYSQFVAITEIEKGENWLSQEENLNEIGRMFNVLEKGHINYKGQKCYWHLVNFDDGPIPLYTLFVGVNKNNRFYIINLSVEQRENYRQKLCRLEPFLDQFQIK